MTESITYREKGAEAPFFSLRKNMKKINLNSLVITSGFTEGDLLQWFPASEIVTMNKVRERYTMDDRPDMVRFFLHECEHDINIRMAIGERAVVCIDEMKKGMRQELITSTLKKGYTVYILIDNIDTFREAKLMNNVVVIDTTRTKFTVAHSLKDNHIFQQILDRGYDGITVIPDTHGNATAMNQAVVWAKNRNNFILFLGDVLDYGKDSLNTTMTAYNLVMSGEAELLRGNHEKKIFRVVSQNTNEPSSMVLSDSNKVTIDALNALPDRDKDIWVNRFKSLYIRSRNHIISSTFAFTHGAVHEDLWSVKTKTVTGRLEEFCLFGEVDKVVVKTTDGYPNRIYNWVDTIPSGHMAIVGHDIRSVSVPLIQQGKLGGQAIFLDTGCSKTGHLSTLDIKFPKVGNFNTF
jgi:hypothetical protein